MQIAIVGGGNVGGALAAAWTRAGHEVTVGVRNPRDPKRAELAAICSLTEVGAAAASAEVVVLATPWEQTPDAVHAAGELGGRIVIDATNPITAGPHGLALSIGHDDSGGEQVARLIPGAAVFKTLNHVSFLVMADATGYPQAPTVFVAGDDEQRKPAVLALVADLGFQPADAGPLRAARLLEPMAVLWVDQAVNHGRAWNDAFSYLHKTTAN